MNFSQMLFNDFGRINNKLADGLHKYKVYGLGIGLYEAHIKAAEENLQDLRSHPEIAVSILKHSSKYLRDEVTSKTWKRDKLLMKYGATSLFAVIGTIPLLTLPNTVGIMTSGSVYAADALLFLSARQLWKYWERIRLEEAEKYENITKRLDGLGINQIKEELEKLTP